MTASDHPLRLAIGSHAAGSGKGCAMNVISWENGDTMITDLPSCADRMLARLVQRVNDAHCTHTRDGMLCAPCSVEVLALAHRTTGTALDLSPAEVAKVHVRLALWCAEQTRPTRPESRRALSLVRQWLDGGPITRQELYAAAAAVAAYAAAAAAAGLAFAHKVIDEFERITGVRGQAPAPEVTEAAVAQMVAR